MLKIYPQIEFSAKCPSDGAELDVAGVAIPGMRCLANTVCPDCGTRYYIDLPVGHALRGSIILNQTTAEIYDPVDRDWFSNPLKEGFLNPVTSEVVPTVHKLFDSDRIVIVNCLDFLYGHSLLKLLNVQRYLDHSPELGCCVLVPSQLVHLVPDGVAEIWEFPVPVKEGWKWYIALERWMQEQLTKRKECFLSPVYSHPSNRVYDLYRFVRNVPDISEHIGKHQPTILFSYREDRLWGRSLSQQQRNLQKLYNQLSAIFPDMSFVLVGFGQHNQIQATGAKLIDLRTNKFNVERDHLWMAYMSAADCAIGIHGSNMLLPSGLAKSTVELVPRSRLGNTVQDFLLTSTQQDSREVLLFYRMLYGDELLLNILPSSVTDAVANVLSYARINSEWFKSGENPGNCGNFESIYQDPVVKKALTFLHAPALKPFLQRKTKRLAELLLAGLD